MFTAHLVTTFLETCKQKHLSQNTITGYASYLTRFAQDNPKLPTDPMTIQNWLHSKGESFTNRGNTIRRLQAFYTYLKQTNTIQTNPIPDGQPGRPKNHTQQHPKPPGPSPTIHNPASKLGPTDPKQADTATLVNDYITTCKARGLSPRTIKAYQTQLNWFILLYPTLTYDLADIQKLWADYGQEHDEWKHQLFRTVRAFYYWLADFKGLPTLLRFRRIAPKRTRKHPDNLDEEKAAQLMALLPTMSPQEKAIIELLIEAGPRASEICSMRKENIFDNTALVKGKTGERIIIISPYIRDTLRSLTPNATGPVFFNKTVKPLNIDCLYRIIKRHLAQIGITTGKRGPHMLRHTMGRLYMASEKGDIESLRSQMGHTNIITTSIYAKLSIRQVQKKVNAANPRERIMLLIHADV
jgi:integrase/recombinase XerD